MALANEPARFSIRPVALDEPELQALIEKLDHYQIGLYGPEHCHLDSIATLKQSNAYMLGAYEHEVLVGMGAIKLFKDYAEIKRMYIEDVCRSQGLAKQILQQLESHAHAHGIKTICLETGYLQVAALTFYKKQGYTEIPCFGSYQPSQVCVYLQKG